MNRIGSTFDALRRSGRRGLMPFVCGGHPSLQATERLLPALSRAGASVIEVGMPFSDPIADGPVIAAAMHEALKAGVTPDGVLESIARAREQTSAGIVVMVSYSVVYRVGLARLVERAAAAGVDGFIFPDLPVEEAEEIGAEVKGRGLTMSLLVAPTTPAARVARIARACTGFVYVLARVGITGTDGAVDVRALAERIRVLRSETDLPVACGFGIASADDVRAVVGPAEEGGAGADAAIVGSALVKRMTRAAASGADAVAEGAALVRALAAGL
ncbi:MAG: tryptophan synthase subunit alpha [Planctomycetota bacterium]|nr:tryptophan synthase subunit alpha [Planctomycetota bacterium]